MHDGSVIHPKLVVTLCSENTDIEATGRRVRVAWDSDGYELPEVVIVPEHIILLSAEDEFSIVDWLSDTYGYCVNSAQVLDSESKLFIFSAENLE